MMRKRLWKRTLAGIAAIGFAITGIAGCGVANKQAGEKLVLNEVAHSVFYAPLYVAMEAGYFEQEGIDLELVTGFGADKTMAAVLADKADIGFMGCESSLYTYSGGVADYVVNFAQLTQRAGNFLVAREPIENFSWEMLKGKKVLGGRAGGMPEMIFEFILKKHNLDPATDLTIDQSIDFGSTAAAFSSGQGDFTVEFEPHATALELKQDGYVVASLGEESGYVPYTAFAAKKSFLESHQEQLQHFTNALQKGMDYVHKHTPEEIAQIIQPQFQEMELEELTAIVKRYDEQHTWKTNLVFEEESFLLLQNILKDAGMVTQNLPYEELVNIEFAAKVAPK